MATGKKYYWIKLKTDFMTSDKVDYIMSQPNGAEYIVLYQMLCMKCINTDGRLARKIGEVIIPFDAEKITRDCKYFKIDTVKEAFRLFIQLGMIYQEEDGCLRISDFENMVGSETDWAAQKRRQAQKALNNTNQQKQITESYGNNVENHVENTWKYDGNAVEGGVENFHTEKEIRVRDRTTTANVNLVLNNKAEKNSEEIPKEIAAVDFIKNKLQELFGHYVFDDNFAPELLALSQQFGLTETQLLEYIDYVFKRVESKKPDSMTNMFYKMAKYSNVMQDFISEIQKNKPVEKRQVKCPVCGTLTEPNGICPKCEFDLTESFDLEKVNLKKQVYLLSPEDKAAFLDEYNAELERQAEYGFDVGFKNHGLRNEFKKNLDKIYSKYGIKT